MWEYREIIVKGNQVFWYDSGGGFNVKALPAFPPKGLLGYGNRLTTTAPLLAELGQDGWELVAVNTNPGAHGDYSLFLKRQKP